MTLHCEIMATHAHSTVPDLYKGDGERGEDMDNLRRYPGSDGAAIGAKVTLPFRLKVEVSVQSWRT